MLAHAARLLRNLAIMLGVFIGVVLVGTELLLHTAFARTRLRAEIAKLASSALDARVEVDRLESISLVHARVGGVRIFDRSGQLVAKAARLHVGITPIWLIAGRLRVNAIVLEYGYVDLGAPADEHPGGLLGLFESDQAERPSSSSDNGLRIELPSIRLLHARVDATWAGARYSARELDTDAGVWIEPGVGLAVRRLHCEFRRNEQSIGGIDGAGGDRKASGESVVRIATNIAGARMTLGARLGAEDAGAQALSAQVDVHDLSGATLAALGVDADWLTAKLTTSLFVTGTTRAFDYKLGIATPGGPIDAAGRFTAPSSLRATLRVHELEPARFLRADVGTLSGSVHVDCAPAAAHDTLEATLALENGRYANTELPKLDAHGEWNSTRGLAIQRFEAAYAAGSVSGDARLTPDGAVELRAHLQSHSLGALPPVRALSAQLAGSADGDMTFSRRPSGALNARLTLALQKPAAGSARAAALQLEAELRGPSFDRAQGSARVQGSALHVGAVDVPTAEVRIAGGPSRYTANGRFGDQGHLDVAFTREGSRFDLDGNAHVVVDRRGNALDAVVRDLHYTDTAISLRSLHVSYLGAQLQAGGQLDKPSKSQPGWRHGRSELTLVAQFPDLRKVSAPWLPTPIPGAAQARVVLRGDLEAPDIRIDARYGDGNVHGLLWRGVTLAAHADLPKRSVAIDVHADEVGGGSFTAKIQSSLPHRPLELSSVRDAEHEISVHVDRVQLSSLDEWPRERWMPIRADLSGDVHAKGTLSAPTIDAKLRTESLFQDENASLAIALNAHYDAGSVALDLDAKDAQGPLLRTKMQTKLEHKAVLDDMQGLGRFIAERSWQVSLWLGARRIDQLPGVRALDVPEALWPAQLSAEGKLAHEPGREPDGSLHVQAIWDPPGRKVGTQACGLSRRPRFDLDVSMKQGGLHADAKGSVEGHEMLALTLKSDEPVDQWLRASAERAQPISIWLKATDLRLQDVPIVCEHATGLVSGDATLARALESNVSAELDLHAKEIRFGGAPPLDAEIAARADRHFLVGSAKIHAKDGSSLIAAHLPIDGGGRVPTLALDAPAQVDLKLSHIDARALLAPVSALRATGGTFQGDVGVRGTLRDPKLQGAFTMRDVSVTLAEAGQRFERVNGKVSLDGNHLHLYPTQVHDRSGSLEISGDATIIDTRSWQLELAAKAKRFRVRRNGIVLALVDGKLGLKARLDPKATELEVTYTDGRVQLTDDSMASVQSLDVHPDVVFTDDGPKAHPEQEQAATPVTLTFRSKNAFWVRRTDFSALVTAQLRIEARGSRAAVSGPVEIERGVVELLGQMFDIEQGKINFTGAYEIEPTLELTAKHEVPGGAVVVIKASGPLYEPQLVFTVDGRAVTAGEALSVATNTSRGTGSNATVQDELSSMAAGIAGSVLTLGARRELGDWVPVLGIERTQDQTRLRAGVEADRFIPSFLRKIVVDAYIEGIFVAASPDAATQSTSSSQTAAANGQALQASGGVLLELRFPRHLVGETQYGPGQQWSVDLSYQP